MRASVPAFVLAAVLGSDVLAQPDPSFRASCSELRSALAKIEPSGEEVVTVQVVGRLTAVRTDNAVAFLSACAAPDPVVVCVTYSASERRVGDEVVLSGAIEESRGDRVLLDPCLHYTPESGPSSK